jgi:hypothetical protein
VTYRGLSNPVSLSYNSIGNLSIQLPQGPKSDSYRIYLFVNIIDDSLGTTVYNLTLPISVTSNKLLVQNLMGSISSNDMSNSIYADLNSGNLNLVTKNVVSLSTSLNIQISDISSGFILNSSVNNQMASLRDFMITKVSNLYVSDVSSIKVISSALSMATKVFYQISSNSAVNQFKYNIFFSFRI